MATELTGSAASTLRDRFGDAVVTPADDGWDAARQAFNLLIDQRPEAVALPSSAAETAAIVTAARELGLRIAPQGSGHNTAPARLARGHGAAQARADEGGRDRRRRAPGAGRGRGALVGRHPTGLRARARGAARILARDQRRRLLARRRHRLARAQARSAVERRHGDRAGHRRRRRAPRRRRQRARPVLGPARRRRELRRRHRDRVRAAADARALRRARCSSRSSATGEVLHAWHEWTADAPDEVTSVGRVLQFPDARARSPRSCAASRSRSIEAVYLGDEADGRELLAPLRELGPQMDTFAIVPPAGLAELHMDPVDPVPYDGHALAASASCRRRRSTTWSRSSGRARARRCSRSSFATAAARSLAPRPATVRSPRCPAAT